LDLDNGLGAGQPPGEAGMVALQRGISAASGLGGVVLRPRLAGVSASKTPAARCRRQSVSAEE
jgi:hypothetical protein